MTTPSFRRNTVVAVLSVAVLAGCTGQPADPSDSQVPPANSASAAPQPSPTTSEPADYQTGSPDPGQKTTAPDKPNTTPTVSDSATVAPGKVGTPRGQYIAPKDVKRTDPSAVAQAAAAALYVNDSRLDNRPADAQQRATPYATAGYRRALAQRPQGRVPGWFTQMAQRDGWTTVTTRLGGLGEAPPDQENRALRAVTVTVTPRSENWTGETYTATLALELRRDSRTKTWAVNSAKALQ